MAKRYKYSFAQKKESSEGIVSTILAGISLVLFLICVIISFALSGKGGIYLGAFGLMAIAFSVFGFTTGLKSFSEEECSHTFCVVGSLSNGLIIVGWVILFLIGISIG